MKNIFLSIVVALLVLVSCNEKQELSYDGKKGTHLKSGEACNCNIVATVTLPEIIDADRVLYCDTLYLLDGKTWVDNAVTLTILPGTRIEGVKKSLAVDASALVVTRNANIVAAGLPECPIVFTAHLDANNPTADPGDWGGVVLLGNATVNNYVNGIYPTIEGIDPPATPDNIDFRYGGNDDSDNSGTLQYVVIEYAGAVIEEGNELNGLTLGGVGCGTTLDHIEVFQGADDGFEFFGGTVSGKYLLSVSNNDDQFDFDNGYSGNLQFLVAIIDPSVLYASNNTNGIECDNNADGTETDALTRPVISNLTIAGPPNCTVSTANQVLNANRWRRNTRFVVRNSIFYNFPTGIRLESSGTINSVGKDTCGTAIDSSYFFDNVVYACNNNNYAGWPSNRVPVGMSVLHVDSIKLKNPVTYSSFFSSSEGLKPNGGLASTLPRYCGLEPLMCDFEFLAAPYKGGATDENGDYWLDDSWIRH